MAERRTDVLHSTPGVSLAVVVLLVVVAGFVAHDLWRSVAEYRAVRAWSVCADPAPDCLVPKAVRFVGPNPTRRSSLQEWRAVPDDGEGEIFTMQPRYDDVASALAGSSDRDAEGTVYRFDGEIVAVSPADAAQHAPTALSGLHATTLDAFALMTLLGGASVGVGSARRGWRAGVGWSGRIPRRSRRWWAPDGIVAFAGIIGVLASLRFALAGTVAWLVTLGCCGVVALVPATYLLLRRVRGVGRHAP